MISTNNQLNSYSKRMNETKEITTSQLYSLESVAPFYSVTLKDFNRMFGFNVGTITKARGIAIILYHINKYPRAYQTKILNLYQFNHHFINPVLKLMNEKGLIKTGIKAKQTNLAAYVSLTVYSLTIDGKLLLSKIDNKLTVKIKGIKPVK